MMVTRNERQSFVRKYDIKAVLQVELRQILVYGCNRQRPDGREPPARFERSWAAVEESVVEWKWSASTRNERHETSIRRTGDQHATPVFLDELRQQRTERR